MHPVSQILSLLFGALRSTKINLPPSPPECNVETQHVEQIKASQLNAPRRDSTGFRLLIQLDEDTWVDEIDSGEHESTFATLRAVRSTSDDERHGWNAVFGAQLHFGNMSRINHNTIEFYLPSNTSYDLLAPETLRIMVPAAAVLSAVAMEAVPLVIEADLGLVELAGGLAGSCTDAALRSTEALELYITLRGDSFVAGVGLPSAASTALLEGIVSSRGGPTAWQWAYQLMCQTWGPLGRLSGAQLVWKPRACCQPFHVPLRSFFLPFLTA